MESDFRYALADCLIDFLFRFLQVLKFGFDVKEINRKFYR